MWRNPIACDPNKYNLMIKQTKGDAGSELLKIESEGLIKIRDHIRIGEVKPHLLDLGKGGMRRALRSRVFRDPDRYTVIVEEGTRAQSATS